MKELVAFITELYDKGITVINSAVFNEGFLVGGSFYNYLKVDPEIKNGKELLT